MAAGPVAVREELLGYKTPDAIIAAALQDAFQWIAAFEPAASLDQIQLCLFNPATATQALLQSPYYTAACQALLAERLIIVNEAFLIEVETGIRSFAQSPMLMNTPFVTRDAQMFGLVRRIQDDPARYLARLRRQATREGADAGAERDIRQQLALVTLFFIGHELGHFMHGHETGSYATFVDAGAPLESRIEDAVVRLCRHIDEFAPTQFELSGFGETSDQGSAVRRAADTLRQTDEKRYARHELFFANEAVADDWANKVAISHLAAVGKDDPVEAEHALYLFACGTFVAALYSWYRDLDVFARKLGIAAIGDSRELDGIMMRDRMKYVHAATLFGEHHRFTLLRAALALEVVLRARTKWFEEPPETRSIWYKGSQPAILGAAGAPGERRWFWLAESLQRYFLLCACMDTAVKLANVGCSTGWIVEADRRRGTPQVFVMQFFGIDHAIARVRQRP